MPKYKCPECEAVLRRENAVPEGKKIKCPKCESIFKPKPLREAEEERDPAKKKVKAAPAANRPDDDEEETGGSYEVIKEKEDPKKKDVHYGSLRDKFKKSKRGPAMAKVVKLSNGMLLIGIATAIACALGIMWGFWPFVFSEESPHGSRVWTQVYKILGSAAGFVYAGCICYGGSKLHDLRSYAWAMAASAMTAIIGVGELVGVVWFAINQFSGDNENEGLLQMVLILVIGAGLAWSVFNCSVGARSLARLKEESIREGFEETREMRDY